MTIWEKLEQMEGGWPNDYDERENLLLNFDITDMPEIKDGETMIIYDTGNEEFGCFRTAKAALKAIKNSDPDWWANYPSYEIFTEEKLNFEQERFEEWRKF